MEPRVSKSMTKKEFEAFLASLDPDRELAGEKYEQIRRMLLTFFRGRGLIDVDTEEAVDKVFDRCAKRSIKGGIENIRSFVKGVARKVASEFHRETRRETPLDAEGPPVNPTDNEEDQKAEIRYRCLRRCLGLLEREQRELVVAWYLYDKGEKIENRKRLAAQRLTTVETLKVRAFRVRRKLRQLVEECMMQASLAAAT
jgi:DNA-directed RNA polymerase specialized sigma24 family protein